MAGVAVSWKTARLTWEDVALLRPGQWLNDAVIGFWQEYLASRPPPEGIAGRDEVLLVDPCAGCCIGDEEDEEDLQDILTPMELPSKDLVLVPISDRADRGGSGYSGNHWSLLALRANGGDLSAEYYDSMGTGNLPTAQRLAGKLARAMRPHCGKVQVLSRPAGKQDNSSDCGVFTLLFIEALCRGTSPADVSPADAARWRHLAAETIRGLSSSKT
eukprot:TRINITY_DN75607_c0_g1_i1.p1 TRINITY_DN75607_c0_g1~~TRINITY_DN75607_c0_g1_i1.p1  ORF type:complete len:232 (+),score=51.94 TRINITY_DN75607_c0_g1_i1:50-697(+)